MPQPLWGHLAPGLPQGGSGAPALALDIFWASPGTPAFWLPLCSQGQGEVEVTVTLEGPVTRG